MNKRKLIKWLLNVGLFLLSVPLLLQLFEGSMNHDAFEHFMHSSGELTARLLIVTLLISPLRLIFSKNRILKWMQANKRSFGLLTFYFGSLHLLGYLVHEAGFAEILAEMAKLEMLLGWLAFVILLALAVTSNNWSMRRFGGKPWKNFQRSVYAATVLSALHWLVISRHALLPVLIHFGPLLALEIYRFAVYLKNQRFQPSQVVS